VHELVGTRNVIPPDSGSEQSRIRAAVIEDNGELLSIVLQGSFDVVTYRTAKEALALPKETPDVVLCDLLPDFDGRAIPKKAASGSVRKTR